MGLFDRLVARYRAARIAYPALKPVTLAQWTLESGRGTSRLATRHLNFAGLKWRSEMVGYATPVAYEASDGLDYYCAFASLDAFIAGYWKFLSRPPYDGWEARAAESPEAFLRFVADVYNPAGALYADRVLALLPEASRRLAEAPDPDPEPPPVPGTPVVVVLDPGHGGTVKVGGSSPNNAASPAGEREKDWTLDVARRTRVAVLARAVAEGRPVEVVLTRDSDANKGLAARANVARARKASLFLSIHFNGFDGKVRGVETLVHPAGVHQAEDRAFAQTVQDRLLATMREIDPTTAKLKKYDRKVRPQKLGVLQDVELGNVARAHPCRACLVEVEFMDTPAVEALFRLQGAAVGDAATAANRQRVADALADALLAHA